MEKDLSIIIVSWNARDFLRACLLSIRQTVGDMNTEIIVVDNASGDGSPEMVVRDFPEVRLLETGKNLGFAAANNRGMAVAKGRYFCLVNSDVILQADCLQVLLAYMTCNPDAGLIAPRILNPDQTVQQSVTDFPAWFDTWFQAFFLHRLYRFFNKTRPGYKPFVDSPVVRDVPVLYGMFWMVSRSAWQDVGNLDERFFMYGEDLDWCKRFHEHSYRIVYVPYATAIHYGGGSSRTIPVRSAVQMRKSRILYFMKHHNRLASVLDWAGMILESSVRFCVWIILALSPDRNTLDTRINIASHVACLRWLLVEGITCITRPRCVSP